VVLEVGLTDTTPPVVDSVCLLPLVPSSVTEVALVACTVNTEEAPGLIDVGLAVMVTLGAEPVLDVTVIFTLVEAVPPEPVAVAV
jgi:hypothetical protein